MSSSANITGLLAQLINGSTEFPTPSTSVRNLNPVSLSTALLRSRSQIESNRTTPSTNATKKAIVLKHVDNTPFVASTANTGTSWFTTMSEMLPNYGVSEITSNAIAATGITNYPKYRIWILPDNINRDSTVPILNDGQVTNLSSFPICSVKDTAIDIQLFEGALIRIDFEDRLLNIDAYVVNVLNNAEEFGRAIFTELEGIASPSDACIPCGDARPSVSHSTGDNIGTHSVGSENASTAADIDRMYPQVAAVSGFSEKIVEVANRLQIPDAGWLANVMYFESGRTFDSQLINHIGCVGLIQFCRDSGESYKTMPSGEQVEIGVRNGAPYDNLNQPNSLASMNQIEQMEYVYNYLSRYIGRLNSSADLYMSIFMPVAVGGGPDYSIYDYWARARGVEYADDYLQDNGGIRTAGDYAALADRNAKLPTEFVVV
jgi:hypothetical protein